MPGLKGRLSVRTSGVIITTPLDGGAVTMIDTVQCVHCQRHRAYVPKSGTKWGWCLACNGIHCATEKCAKCVPSEQWLENVEAGRPEDYRPIRIAVPDGLPEA